MQLTQAARLEKIILKVFYLVTPVILFLPLLVSSKFYYPFITPRNFVFRIIVEIFFALYVCLVLIQPKKYLPRKEWPTIIFLGLAVWMTIASLVNGYFQVSFWSNFERMDGLIALYHLVAFFFIILAVYRDKASLRHLLYVSVFVSFITSILALAQYFDIPLYMDSAGGSRVSSTLGNAAFVASYALFQIFFAVYLLVTFQFQRAEMKLFGRWKIKLPFGGTTKKLRWEFWAFMAVDVAVLVLELLARRQGNPGTLSVMMQYPGLAMGFLLPQVAVVGNVFVKQFRDWGATVYFLTLLALNFITLFNTQTRGPLLGIAIALFLMFTVLIFTGRLAKKFRLTAAVALVIFLTLIAGIFVFKDKPLIKNNGTLNRIASISLNDATSESRLLTWKLSWQGFLDRPVFGWGEERFNIVFNKYFPVDIYRHSNSQVWFDRPHNVFLQYLVHGGLPGALLYLGIYLSALIILWRNYWRERKISYLVLCGLLIAYAVQNAFVFDSLNTSTLMIILIALAVGLKRQSLGDETPLMELNQPKKLRLALLPIVAIVSVGIIYLLNVPQMTKNLSFVSAYNDARQVKNLADLEKSNQQLLKIVDDNIFLGRFELRQVYSEFVVDVSRNEQVDLSIRKNIIDQAAMQLNKTIQADPENSRHYAYLTNLYLAGSQIDPEYAQKNLDVIAKGVALSPTRTPYYYSLGRSYIVLRDAEKAVQAFQKAVELSPNVPDAHLNLLAAYLTVEDRENVNKQIEIINGMTRSFRIEAFVTYARILQAAEKGDQAYKILQQGMTFFPQQTRDNAELYAEMSAYLYRNNKYYEALKYAEKAAELDRERFYSDLVKLKELINAP